MTLTDSPLEAGNTLGLVIGLLVTFLIVLMGVVIVTICLAAVVVRKRKATIRSLQLEVLTRCVVFDHAHNSRTVNNNEF